MAINADIRRARRLEAARGYLELEMPDHALRELNRITDQQTCVFEVNQLRGEALRQRTDYESALGAFSRALDERPDDPTILMGMAWCYKRTNQLPRAIWAMEQAYQAAPEEPLILYNLACYFALNGQKPQALSWLGRALRMRGDLRKLIADESDFDKLRDDADFQFVAGVYDLADGR